MKEIKKAKKGEGIHKNISERKKMYKKEHFLNKRIIIKNE